MHPDLQNLLQDLLHGAWSPFFWASVTLGLYALARVINGWRRRWWSSPLLLAWLGCLAAGLLLQASYQEYLSGTGWLSMLIGPATIAFAVPIYDQRHLIRRHWPVLLLGITAGSIIAASSAWALADLLALPPDLTHTLETHSITTPFAMAVSEKIGGVPQLAAIATAITGLVGAVIGEILLATMKLRSSFARGAMFGMGAHSVGVAKAHELGSEEGSVASLVMVLAGLANIILAPMILALAQAI